jgi:hypothetical protein
LQWVYVGPLQVEIHSHRHRAVVGGLRVIVHVMDLYVGPPTVDRFGNQIKGGLLGGDADVDDRSLREAQRCR